MGRLAIEALKWAASAAVFCLLAYGAYVLLSVAYVFLDGIGVMRPFLVMVVLAIMAYSAFCIAVAVFEAVRWLKSLLFGPKQR